MPLITILAWLLAPTSALYASQVSEGDFPVTEVSFWSRRYQIPKHYEFSAVSLRVKNREASKRSAHAMLLAHGALQTEPDGRQVNHATGPAATPSYWLVPSARAQSLLDNLLKLGTLSNFYRGEYRSTWRDSAGPDPAEVYFKRDALVSEWRLLSSSRAALPSVGGLLDSQLASLEALVRANDDAHAFMSVSLLLVDWRADKPLAAAHPTWDIRSVEVPTHSSLYGTDIPVSTSFPAGFWRRSGSQFPCGAKSDPLQVTIDALDPAAALVAAESCLRTSGATSLLDECVPAAYLPGEMDSQTPHLAKAAWVEPRRLESLRRCLGGLGQIREWDHSGVSVWQAIGPEIPQKYSLLRRELSVRALDSTPVLRGFLAAETRRLKPMDAAYRATASRELLNIVVLPARSP